MTLPPEMIEAAARAIEEAYGDVLDIQSEPIARVALTAALSVGWRGINSEPSDDSTIWLSDGEIVWLGCAHKDGSLRLPSRDKCKFWMPANQPLPPPPERKE